MTPITSAKRYEIEYAEEWRKIMDKIPFVAFKPEWEVAVIPPFSGAVARFWVRVRGTTKQASIYLDWFDNLGCMGEPYWEIYPVDGDTERCLLNETDKLIEAISKSLSETPNPSEDEGRGAEQKE